MQNPMFQQIYFYWVKYLSQHSCICIDKDISGKTSEIKKKKVRQKEAITFKKLMEILLLCFAESVSVLVLMNQAKMIFSWWQGRFHI